MDSQAKSRPPARSSVVETRRNCLLYRQQSTYCCCFETMPKVKPKQLCWRVNFHEMPIKIPARKTSAPPSMTCSRADTRGVSMYLCRTQEMMPSSASTTHDGDGGGGVDVWNEIGQRVAKAAERGHSPQTNPRAHGWPRPVRLPSSDSASANPMLMPAPTAAASPTRKVAEAAVRGEGGGKTTAQAWRRNRP